MCVKLETADLWRLLGSQSAGWPSPPALSLPPWLCLSLVSPASSSAPPLPSHSAPAPGAAPQSERENESDRLLDAVIAQGIFQAGVRSTR